MKIERPTPHVMPLGRSTRFVEFGGAALTRRLMAMWCFAREIWSRREGRVEDEEIRLAVGGMWAPHGTHVTCRNRTMRYDGSPGDIQRFPFLNVKP
jgi:hypothetical protein